MIVASCPTRLSLGSADHNPFAERYQGVALNFCIDKKIYVILRRRTKLENAKYRISYSKTELCYDLDEIELEPVKQALLMTGVDTPLEIIYTADVPARLGLATSSAFVLALLKALYYLKDEPVSNEVLAERAYELERELLGQPGGFQDQYIGWGGVSFLRGSPHRVSREALVLQPAQVREFEDHFFLIYTGEQKSSERVLPEQLEKLAEGTTLDHTLAIKSLVQEAYAMMLKPSFHPMDLAENMNEQWRLKKQLSKTITNDAINRIEEAVLAACPHAGMRLVGSGGRGFMLVICPKEIRERLMASLPKYKTSTFKLDWDGCRVAGTHKYLSI